MLHDQVHKKITGILPKDKEGQLDDLAKYSIQQLKELINRQEKIISNKKFVSTLPDKGEKLFRKLSELKSEYSERCDVSKLAEDVKKLSVSHEEAVVSVEWTREIKLGSDSSRNREEKEREEEKYIGLLLAKVGKDEKKAVFKPYRTIRSQRDEETPQLLSLQESFVLQKQQDAKLKEQASERLLRQMCCQDVDASASGSSAMQFLDYRDSRQEDDPDDDND